MSIQATAGGVKKLVKYGIGDNHPFFAPPPTGQTGVHPRSMRYAYTFAAKWRNFPWRFHWEYWPILRYLIFAQVMLMPFWYWLEKKQYSPEYYNWFYNKYNQHWDEHRKHLGHRQKEADHKHFGFEGGHH